jgi:hypothetical protein
MRSDDTRRIGAASLGAALLLLLLLGALGMNRATARPGALPRWYHSPPVGGHIYSLGLLPCTRSEPGRLLIGRDIIALSVYPPPGWSLATAPPCP